MYICTLASSIDVLLIVLQTVSCFRRSSSNGVPFGSRACTSTMKKKITTKNTPERSQLMEILENIFLSLICLRKNLVLWTELKLQVKETCDWVRLKSRNMYSTVNSHHVGKFVILLGIYIGHQIRWFTRMCETFVSKTIDVVSWKLNNIRNHENSRLLLLK